MSQNNSREPTPTPDFHMIEDEEIVEDLLNSDVESEIHMSEECMGIKNTFLDKMSPLLDDMLKGMYNSMYADCLDLMLDEDKLSQIQANDRLTRSRCLELEDNCQMLEGNIAQLNTEIDGMSKANENLSLIHQSDQNTISSLTNKVKELSILVANLEDRDTKSTNKITELNLIIGSLEEGDDKAQEELQECANALSEANKLIKRQQSEIDELKREKYEMEEQIEDLCVLDTTGNNYHNLEMLSNVCSVYHHEEANKETPSSPPPPPLNYQDEVVNDASSEVSEVFSYRKTLRSGKSYN